MWCRKFYSGVAVESGTCQAGSLDHDHCLTPSEGNELSCGTIAHCPSASSSSGGQCDRCATILAQDWNQEIRLSEHFVVCLRCFPNLEPRTCDSAPCFHVLTSFWQDNLATTIPIYTREITSTTTTTTTATATSTTSSSATSLTTTSLTGTTATFTLTTVTATSHTTSSQTTVTTVTTTTVTATMEAPAQLEGCVVLSVSDADLFAESSDAKEAFRKTLAQAAGDGVEPEYVQENLRVQEVQRFGWHLR
eukprot:g3041.t2